MTYAQAIEFLYGLSRFGAKLGLDKTLKLAQMAGNPQLRLRFIHVAGTNGKGSTCAMLESIYRSAGLRVGLFTSPHLVSFRERIQVNRELISEADVARLVEQTIVGQDARPLRGGTVWWAEATGGPAREDARPTLFELVTIIALRYFEEQQCDLVIWETGLGGRLDATNIVTPLASVITNIQLDHEKWLGETLDKIAAEKAGIIKRGVPAVTATEDANALAVIHEAAQLHGSPLIVVTTTDADRPPLDSIQLPLLGEHQKVNAAVALATVRALNGLIPINDTAIRKGLESVHWPGRLQLVRINDGRTVLLDGAHNPAGVETLAAALPRYFLNARMTLIFATLHDKNWDQMCRTLAPLFRRILLTPVQSERSANPVDLKQACCAANPSAEVTVCSSIDNALQWAVCDPFIVITGSLHFIGEAATALRLAPDPDRNEQRLNDWKLVANG